MRKKPPTENSSQLGNILARYKNRFKPPQSAVEKVVIEGVAAVAGFALKKEQVAYTVSSKTVTFKVPSIIKSEIKAKHKELSVYLSAHLPESDVPKVLL